MANAFIPRDTVHAWSEQIGQQLGEHETSIQRLLKDQRRLTKFIETYAEQMGPGTAGVCVYMTGVIARMFELAGGSTKSATWEQVRDAERRVLAHLDALLPLDEALVDRFHGIARAQAHILDEAAMVLMQTPSPEGQPEMDPKESLKILIVSWVVTEVLDANWRPPAGFAGEATYAYHHIEPKPLPALPAT
jgi:hypothetical protein